MLEIAQAAMDEFGRGRGCAGSEVALFDKHDLEAAPCGIAGNAYAIDAAPYNGQVKDARVA
jgi:hypothetical protein